VPGSPRSTDHPNLASYRTFLRVRQNGTTACGSGLLLMTTWRGRGLAGWVGDLAGHEDQVGWSMSDESTEWGRHRFGSGDRQLRRHLATSEAWAGRIGLVPLWNAEGPGGL
jgi:hypothetical protein